MFFLLTAIYLFARIPFTERSENMELSNIDTYGIEIEFVLKKVKKLKARLEQLKEEHHIHNDWILKRERSCDDKKLFGYEINSPVMNHDDKWLCELKLVLQVLKEEAEITDKCAIHIHVGTQILEENVTYFQNLILLTSFYEDILIRFGTGNYHEIRSSFEAFSKPMSMSLPIDKIKLCVNQKLSFSQFLKAYIKDLDRHYTVNLKNCYESRMFAEESLKDTVEFRFFASTFDYQMIISQIELIFKTMEYAKKLPNRKANMYYQALLHRKEYPEIERKIPVQKYMKLKLEKATHFSSMVYSDDQKQKQFMKVYQNKTKSYSA